MCSPALILGMAGAAVQGISAVAGKQTEAANYRIQQDAATRDAALKRESGAYEGARAIERGRQFIGKQIVSYASHGISPSSGSALDVITATGADIGLDVAAARYGTARAIENDQFKAKVAGMNASASSAAAPLAFVAPILSVGATFLQGSYAPAGASSGGGIGHM